MEAMRLRHQKQSQKAFPLPEIFLLGSNQKKGIPEKPSGFCFCVQKAGTFRTILMEPLQPTGPTEQKKAGTCPMTQEDFGPIPATKLYWICNGGFLINSRGTTILIDPVLEGFDLEELSSSPITSDQIDHVDAIVITHCDNDHFGKTTLNLLKDKCDQFHGPHYIAELFQEMGIPATGHSIGDTFSINGIQLTLTPADHAWQNLSPKHASIRHYEPEDYCGYYIETPDGSIWLPGDSRLMDEQLHMKEPDVLLLDLADSKWHLGHHNIPVMTAAYPHARIIPVHWGCTKSTMKEFNGDPDVLDELVVHPERVEIAALGEPIDLPQSASINHPL